MFSVTALTEKTWPDSVPSYQFNVKARQGERSELRDVVISRDNKQHDPARAGRLITPSQGQHSQDNISASITLTLTRKAASPTFRERVALNLRDLDREGASEGGPAGDHSQNYRVVVVQSHVNVH